MNDNENKVDSLPLLKEAWHEASPLSVIPDDYFAKRVIASIQERELAKGGSIGLWSPEEIGLGDAAAAVVVGAGSYACALVIIGYLVINYYWLHLEVAFAGLSLAVF